MKTKRLEWILRGCILMVLIVATILHPRRWKIFIIACCMVADVISLLSKKEKTKTEVWWAVLWQICGIAIMFSFSPFWNVLFQYHAPYEYRHDITVFKEKELQKYSHFPDRIPEGASKVKWRCYPGALQDSNFEVLFFRADQSYLDEICEMYEEYATIYPYREMGWQNEVTERFAFFPGTAMMPEQERKNSIIYVMYDNEDARYPSSSGFCINEVEGYIYYFAQ